MAMQTDVKAATLTSSDTAVDGRCRVKAVYYIAGASAGSVIVKDGGSGGDTVCDLATPGSATAIGYVLFPGEGVLCQTDAYVDITNATSVTVFYA
jgi:hypothetical protein